LTSPILPGATLGVLGGGQLGRMFALAAASMGYRVIAYTDEPDSPVSSVCASTYHGSFDDTNRLKLFAKEAQVVTIEFENIPVEALRVVEEFTHVRPGAMVLHTAQNRLREKTFLSANGYPVVPFKAVNSFEGIQIEQFGIPAVLKSVGFGYDGKGQRVIEAAVETEQAWVSLGEAEAILEKFVPFEKEVSVIGARSPAGEFAAYGPIENQHKNHILDVSIVPGQISDALANEAIALTRSLMDALDVIGLLCVEFFVMQDEKLLINELAPRPHNSGHYSMEGCPTSQFEQLVRAICGLPLGTTSNHSCAAMVNLMGDLWEHGEPDWAAALAVPHVYLHLYGKRTARPGRKMGHLTACCRTVDEAVTRAKKARELLSRTRA